MELWQLDVIGGIALEGGRYLKVGTGVDDHSRFCVLATVVVSETARAVAGAFAGYAGYPVEPFVLSFGFGLFYAVQKV